MGSVAMASRSTQRTMFQPAPLTVKGVLQEFRVIATQQELIQSIKEGTIKKLLVAAKARSWIHCEGITRKVTYWSGSANRDAALTHAIVLEANKTAGIKEKPWQINS